MVKRIAIIPARGGSKRIPRKNIIEFHGKPLISWTIEAALESGLFSKVLVSTDDEEIAEVATQFGAEAPFLRKSHADDHSTASDATVAALIQSQDYWGTQFDEVVQLMPNCPLRTANNIVAATNSFRQEQRNFQISAFQFGWMNPWWAARLNTKSQPDWIFGDAIKQRSQDLDILFCPTGAIWIAKVPNLLQEKTFYGEGHAFEIIDWADAIDIDDENDLKMASVLAKMREEKRAQD